MVSNNFDRAGPPGHCRLVPLGQLMWREVLRCHEPHGYCSGFPAVPCPVPQSLKRKEKEYEHEMERLAREKIATQQRLGELKNELSQWMDVLEIDRVLRQTGQPEDDQASTSTASGEPWPLHCSHHAQMLSPAPLAKFWPGRRDNPCLSLVISPNSLGYQDLLPLVSQTILTCSLPSSPQRVRTT